MKERPVSLTIIAWFIIIGALLTLVGLFRALHNPMAASLLAHSPFPLSVHIGFAVAGLIVNLIAGFGILKGYPWARWLYVGWGLLSLAFSAVTVPVISILVVSALFLLVITFFLFREPADAWFGQPRPAAGQ